MLFEGDKRQLPRAQNESSTAEIHPSGGDHCPHSPGHMRSIKIIAMRPIKTIAMLCKASISAKSNVINPLKGLYKLRRERFADQKFRMYRPRPQIPRPSNRGKPKYPTLTKKELSTTLSAECTALSSKKMRQPAKPKP